MWPTLCCNGAFKISFNLFVYSAVLGVTKKAHLLDAPLIVMI